MRAAYGSWAEVVWVLLCVLRRRLCSRREMVESVRDGAAVQWLGACESSDVFKSDNLIVAWLMPTKVPKGTVFQYSPNRTPMEHP